MTRRHLALCLPILLAACSGGDDAAQGGLSADDAKRLDAAAAKLDAEMQPTAQEQSTPQQPAAADTQKN